MEIPHFEVLGNSSAWRERLIVLYGALCISLLSCLPEPWKASLPMGREGLGTERRLQIGVNRKTGSPKSPLELQFCFAVLQLYMSYLLGMWVNIYQRFFLAN